MQIEIKIDPDCREPKLIIVTDKVSEEVSDILNKLSEDAPKVITGFREDTAEIIEPQDISRFYANSGKVFATTTKGEFQLRIRLYEIEENLNLPGFVRISNSEIINLKKVKNFDLSFTGTICVALLDGTVTYVSRRYVNRIKKILGI